MFTYNCLLANTNIKNLEFKTLINSDVCSGDVRGLKIEFNNLSLIEFISANDCFKGTRLNLLIAHPNIDKRIINNVLLPCEKLGYYKVLSNEN